MSVELVPEKRRKKVNTGTLEFLRHNVYSVTELTRQKKLTEILDLFAERTSEEVFVIQNAKKKDAQAVIVDLQYFQELLRLKEEMERAMDEVALQEAGGRIGEAADLKLTDVFDDAEIDTDAILRQLQDE
ncbi:hypothetical protein [Sporosarcina trichiuri]|uniref:hypothetical protein n=1 Tax=Sporosarcina trichiuri TaxID=3056445 RepID=UPI0025B5E084|nr:hypothetical protein [Sporosarcina sp. 0.2-SM1T-5]WJY26385.1 hypothetical protein QWT68_09840 [Sporosarcina sp. 0.2-SM1T-5]